MPYSYVRYTANGTQTQFSVPFPFIQRDHVLVTLQGTSYNPGSIWNWVNDGIIEFTSAPQANELIMFERSTSRDARLVDYQDGALLDEETLDLDSLQMFYMMQEAFDRLTLTAEEDGSITSDRNAILDTISGWVNESHFAESLQLPLDYLVRQYNVDAIIEGDDPVLNDDILESNIQQAANRAALTVNELNAEIQLRATQVDVEGLTTRIGDAEVNISANTSEIGLRATTATVNGIDSRLSSAETTISGHDATITNNVVQATFNGDDVTYQAGTSELFTQHYFVKLDTNGKVAGFGLYNDDNGSEFIVRTDKFAIIDPNNAMGDGNEVYPFVYNAGTIQMNANLLVNGSITVAKIGDTNQILNANQAWADVSGTGRPADNATVGATWDSNISAQPADSELLNGLQTNGANLCYNSDFSNGLDGWQLSGNHTPEDYGVDHSASWTVKNSHTAWMKQAGPVNPADEWATHIDFTTPPANRIPVVEGNRYCLSVYTGADRARARAYIGFYDDTDTFVGSWTSTTEDNDNQHTGGTRLVNYKRLHCFATAPTNAATASIILRKYDTKSGETSSYAFFSNVMFSEVNAHQTTPPGYQPFGTQIPRGWLHSSDTTRIDGGRIYADSITTAALAANCVTAAEINVSSLSAITATLGSCNITSGAGLTVLNGGDITVNSGGDITVNDGGNLNVNAGGDILLTGDDSDPARIRFTGSSYNVETGFNAAGTTFDIDPNVDGQVNFNLGYSNNNSFWRFYWAAYDQVQLDAHRGTGQVGGRFFASSNTDSPGWAGLEVYRTGGYSVRMHLTAGAGGTPSFYPNPDNQIPCGTSGQRWTAVYAVNGTIQTSDARDKEQIIESDLGLEFIQKIQPVSYRWLDKPSVKHYGLIAQDVEDALDGCEFGGLYYTPETDRYGLQYSEFISPLIKAVQQLAERIERLENESTPS